MFVLEYTGKEEEKEDKITAKNIEPLVVANHGDLESSLPTCMNS